MDAVDGLLDGPRARGAFLLRLTLDPPWSLRVRDEAPLTLMSVVRGRAWAIPDAGDAVLLGPGDVAVMRGPDHYTVADDPASPPQVVVHPGEVCMSPDGQDLRERMSLGVRTWGNSPDGESVVLVGTYQMDGEVSGRLLRALPALLVLPARDLASPLVPLLESEISVDEPGQEAVLDRILDLLLIAVLRAWFARPDAGAPSWYRAYADPVVGLALRLMHNQPERPWTVAGLAREAGASRAAFARRFTDMVGEPPMTFLAGWRIALAADLLREPDANLGSVAPRVGYATPFALSAAFKRVRGMSPRHYLAAADGG